MILLSGLLTLCFSKYFSLGWHLSAAGGCALGPLVGLLSQSLSRFRAQRVPSYIGTRNSGTVRAAQALRKSCAQKIIEILRKQGTAFYCGQAQAATVGLHRRRAVDVC